MSTDLALANQMEVPAHLLMSQEDVASQNAAATGGITAGGFPRLGIGGSKFHIIEDKEKTLITQPGTELPLMELPVVILGWSDVVMKTYYEGDYTPGDNKEPDCRSDNGITPDADVAKKQATKCADCPQNVWGSKVSKFTGKDVKACDDGKRVALVAAEDLRSQPLALNITPGVLKDWKKYVDMLSGKRLSLGSVITLLTFDPTANFPKLQFAWGGFLDEEQDKLVKERAASDAVQSIVTPRKVSSLRLTPPVGDETPPTAPPVALPAVPTVAAAVEGALDPRIAHLDIGMQTAINAIGIDSEAGQNLLKQFPAPVAEVAPEPVDPYANVPKTKLAGIKLAVEAVGGPESDPGVIILAGFKPKKAKATKAPDPAPPVVETAPVAPPVVPPVVPADAVAVEKGFAEATKSSGAASQLEDMLAEAMKQ